MFGINDDDKPQVGHNPAAHLPLADDPTVPMKADPASAAINPISGNEILGPPQVSSGLPAIMPGPGHSSKMVSPHLENASAVPKQPPINPPPLTAPMAISHPLDDGAPGLLSIKQSALGDLSSLIHKLEQPPDQKFKTIMMLIQASDNQQLVQQAYEAANAIPDEQARAQALLDVVNEINYFTHPENSVDKK